ncbi:KICSTOR complex protein kaptin isoform X2 [Anabrus simplex]|uniref:KICSTOR complex protein kaptin isoform X2 n=1 Tax=Anabrus simplex TaxID=316456 RepID=UPI0034DD8798
MQNMIDAHYFLLPSQGNVYSITKLCMSNGVNKILAASLRRKVFSFEYTEDPERFLKPSVREVLFTYIPSGAEIIALDAFNKSQASDDFVIGITIIKSRSDQNVETYLNIYSEWEPNSEFNLESVAQNCLMLELNFIPYHLYHTSLPADGGNDTREVVWLLSGSDKKIHMFREDHENHCYSEVETAEYFPELIQLPSIALWIDVYYCKQSAKRLSAFGCECGYFRLAVVDGLKKEVLANYSARFEGPISSVHFFTKDPDLKCPSFLDLTDESNDIEEMDVNLVISNTLQPSVVYMNVIQQGLKKAFTLVDSDQYDAVLCSYIADIDMDGTNEILLGTYGQMLVYKHHEGTNENAERWVLTSQRSFANPIHAMLYLDITGDGVREFVVLTLRGVHIMQHDADEVSEKFMRRFQELNCASLILRT